MKNIKDNIKLTLNNKLVEELSTAKPYMLRNDGKLLECGDVHPYISYTFEEKPINNLYELLFSQYEDLVWFYNNTAKQDTRDLIISFLASAYFYFKDNPIENLPAYFDDQDQVIESILGTVNFLGINIFNCKYVKTLGELLKLFEELNICTNQEFCRVRTSDLRYGGYGRDIYFRISSLHFNWFDLIWSVVLEDKRISDVTIVRDTQTFGGSYDPYKINGVKIEHMPREEFLTLPGNPVVEKLEHKSDVSKNNFDNFQQGKTLSESCFYLHPKYAVSVYKANIEEKLSYDINNILQPKVILEKIVKKGNKWQVQSEKGKNMGTYDTKEEAEKRLQQVHYFKHMRESYISEIFKIGTAGFIRDDGTFVYADEDEEFYHGGFEEEILDKNYPEFSNTHPEEDTCVRLFKEPNEIQYKKLEEVIDTYLDFEQYCKIEIWSRGKYNFYKVYSLIEGACEDNSWEENVGNWTGYKLIQIIKNFFKLSSTDNIKHMNENLNLKHIKSLSSLGEKLAYVIFSYLYDRMNFECLMIRNKVIIEVGDKKYCYYFNDDGSINVYNSVKGINSDSKRFDDIEAVIQAGRDGEDVGPFKWIRSADAILDYIDKEGVKDESLTESLLLEKRRNDLLAKSRAGDNYKTKGREHENRYTRRTKSKIAATVADYNHIDMNAFFKGDILEFGVKVQGETNNYVVLITFDGVLKALQNEVIRNKNKLEFKCVVRAIMQAFNNQDVLVSCSCLHPDTKIKLLDGTTPTVAEMKQRFDSGEQLYVYSTDSNGDFKPGVVEKVWITKKEKNLIKITLDNGESIITTLDHPYMLRDGSYKLAEDLVVGQSLMPMYFNYGANGYERVKFNSEQRGWHSIYKIVADYFKANEIEEAKTRVSCDDNMSYDVAIHHKDFNKRNNNPENLQIMTAKEHWDYHNSLTWENKPEEMKENIRKTSRENALKRNANPTEKMLECRRTFIEKGHQSAQFRNHDPECLKKQADLMRQTMKDYYNNISEETLTEIKNKRSLGIKKAFERGCFKTEKFIQARHNAFKQERTPEFNLYQQRCKIGKIIQKILDASEIPSPETYEKYRTKGYPKFTSGFDTWDDLTKYFSLNHKIVAIEYITLDEPIDVYDIKVKDWENFVVDAGVVLHNCPDWTYTQQYWATQGRYNSDKPQLSNGKWIANPHDTKGAGCKHINLVLSNLNWAFKLASTIHNYINYCKEFMENNYALYIFPVIYGKNYEDVVQMSVFDYNPDGSIKTELIDDEETLNLANAIGRVRGRFRSDIRVNNMKNFNETEDDMQFENNLAA